MNKPNSAGNELCFISNIKKYTWYNVDRYTKYSGYSLNC